MSSSLSEASISITLVMVAEPGTATADVLIPGRARPTRRATTSPTPSTSLMFFSTTAFGVSGSTP